MTSYFPPMLGIPGPTELFLIFLIVLLLFGGKRLPEIIRGVAAAIREFRKAFKPSDKNRAEDGGNKEGEKKGDGV